MKADTCGTFTEQQRARMGWKPLSERKVCGADLTKCCSSCKHFQSEMYTKGDEGRDVRFRCVHVMAGFATRASSGCDKFEWR